MNFVNTQSFPVYERIDHITGIFDRMDIFLGLINVNGVTLLFVMNILVVGQT